MPLSVYSFNHARSSSVGHDVNVGDMSLNKGANLDVGADNEGQLKDIYLNNTVATGSVNADNLVDNRTKTKMLANNSVVANSDYPIGQYLSSKYVRYCYPM